MLTYRPPSRIPARAFALVALGIVLVLAGLTDSAEAATKRRAPARQRVTMPASATDPSKDAALIVDGATGKILYARNETLERHPASLTKMMTLYLLFDALKNGKMTMQTQMPVSAHAQKQKPTKMGLRRGQTINVDTAIRALVIRSANDVAVVVAEALGGTEGHFAQMMNEKARALGMKETNYHNASGLPDPLQITTAMDLAVLSRRLAYDFPQYFPYFGLPGFTYKGTFYATHDNLIGRYQGADGIKTGYVGASGFNLASSVVRDGVHLIAIVMGGRTAVRRDREMMRLLDIQFAQIQSNPAMVARTTVPWRNVAAATPPPALAGFSLAPAAAGSNPFAALAALTAAPTEIDEDSAEAHRAPDENLAAIPSAPQPAIAPPRPAAPPAFVAAPAPAAVISNARIPAIRPSARPDTAPAMAKAAPAAAVAKAAAPAANVKMAALVAKVSQPAVPAPMLRPEIGEGDVDQPGIAGRNWTVQIGAYADQADAKAQLDSYASKARDVVGQTPHIIAPIQSANGHTLYRARFGPFAEREARDVCGQLTQRGQTCFAVVTR